ncbi:MAG: hypothetical protein ACREHD_24590, partial [Pirellulales bacterium]
MDTSRLAVAAALAGLLTAGLGVAQPCRADDPAAGQPFGQSAALNFDGGTPEAASQPTRLPGVTTPAKDIPKK